MKFVSINFIQLTIIFLMGAAFGISIISVFIRFSLNIPIMYVILSFLGSGLILTFYFRKELNELETRLKLGDQ